MTYNGEDHSTIKNILHAFSKYFESVFLVDDGCPLPYCKTIDVPQFKLPHVTAEQMKKEILDLDQYSCCGYDNFSALFLIQGVSDKCDQFRLYITGAFFTQFCQDWYQMKDE